MNQLSDPTELSRKYMDLYNEIVQRYQSDDIQDLVEALNESLRKHEMNRTNEYYSKILDWNFKVANLDGARKALSIQFSYLRLPSPMMFTVVYDEDDKIWKFNA